MSVVVVGNATSQLWASPEVLSRVRSLVAYREAELPTIASQAVLKEWFKKHKVYGGNATLELVLSDLELCAKLSAAGLDPVELDGPTLLRVRRQRGLWDGWRRMVGRDGTFPTGLLGYVRRALAVHLGGEHEVRDARERPPPGRLRLGAPIELRPYQEEAVDAFIAGTRGVVELPPRSGKTEVAIKAAQTLCVPTLVVVPTKGLVAQTVAAFERRMPRGSVMGVTGGRPSARVARALLSTPVWVMTPQTAAGPKRGGTRPGISGLGTRRLLVVDEFHHAAADTYQDLSVAARACYWRLGLTGTYYRADGRDMAMHGVLARVAYRRSVSDMIALGHLVPARVLLVRVPGTLGPCDGRKLPREGIAEWGPRNKALAAAARLLVGLGRRVLVLTRMVEHSEVLSAMIPGSVQVDARAGDGVQRAIADLELGRVRCLVGTSVIGEGVDVPAADALVYAAGGKSAVKVVQDYFRVLTASPGKKRGIVVDGADLHDGRLLGHSAHRLALYRRVPEFEAYPVNMARLGEWLHWACA